MVCVYKAINVLKNPHWQCSEDKGFKKTWSNDDQTQLIYSQCLYSIMIIIINININKT